MLSGGFADRKHTARLASVEFCALAQNYARSRGAIPSVKKAIAFLTGERGSAAFFLRYGVGCDRINCIVNPGGTSMDAFRAWLGQLQFDGVWQTVVLVAASLLCITFHETCHGLVAYWLGDPTAKRAGRLTLNPLRRLFLVISLTGTPLTRIVPLFVS